MMIFRVSFAIFFVSNLASSFVEKPLRVVDGSESFLGGEALAMADENGGESGEPMTCDANGEPCQDLEYACVCECFAEPTPAPTAKPTPAPTAKPTPAPTAKPTPAPSAKPTIDSPRPSASPTACLLDPNDADLFVNNVSNALDPDFIYIPENVQDKNKTNFRPRYNIKISEGIHDAGLVGGLTTMIWGYGSENRQPTWPGRTLLAKANQQTRVKWRNNLPWNRMNRTGYNKTNHLLTGCDGTPVLDETLHWAYDLENYTQYSVEENGMPIVVHLHGGHSESKSDGNPEFFYSPKNRVTGPQYVEKTFFYDNDQPAGTNWVHDHALGITRLNVYAGMAGFYIIRDDVDTGNPDNIYNLPVFPFEVALAIQDRFFKADGNLFYPAFPGDPWYSDFMGSPPDSPAANFTDRPSALAEFFGDHMVVNGKVWPKMDVERRNYRLRFLNGCDSRFLAIEFYMVAGDATDWAGGIQMPFIVIGKDQGLIPTDGSTTTTLLFETGSRYDIIFDFSKVPAGSRVILANRGGNAPFQGAIPNDNEPPSDIEGRYQRTDRIMAFDVLDTTDPETADDIKFPLLENLPEYANVIPDRVRKVALFEGTDEYGRLQPILGTAEPATDYLRNPIYWPNDCGDDGPYCKAGLAGRQIEGTAGWHSITTENPALDSIEEWEIWNVSPDAHPIHLHLVHFEIISRHPIIFDTAGEECNGAVPTNGICLEPQPLVQHNGEIGSGFKIVFPAGNCASHSDSLEGNCYRGAVDPGEAYVEGTHMDIVTTLPGQVTKIRAKFDRPDRYVWHCHIISHEDHEMMRTLFVGEGAFDFHNETDGFNWPL